MIPLQFALRRRMMMARGLLPSEYTQVEYIQGIGSQYIDTGFVVNKSDNYVLEIDGLFLSQAQAYQGCNGYMQFFTSSKYGISGDSSVAVGNRNTVRVEYANQTEKLFVDGAQIESKSWSTYNGSNVKLGILRLGDVYNGWFTGPIAQGMIYGYKVWKNNILVSECVPCVRNSDNKVGVYDIIQKNFITNAGAGTFIAPGMKIYTVKSYGSENGFRASVTVDDVNVKYATISVVEGARCTVSLANDNNAYNSVIVNNATVAGGFGSVSYTFTIDSNTIIENGYFDYIECRITK